MLGTLLHRLKRTLRLAPPTPAGQDGMGEDEIIRRALEIMASRLRRPCYFQAVQGPDAFAVHIQFEPPSPDKPAGYVGASISYGPKPGETHERGRDLADGDYSKQTLEEIISDIREKFAEGRYQDIEATVEPPEPPAPRSLAPP